MRRADGPLWLRQDNSVPHLAGIIPAPFRRVDGKVLVCGTELSELSPAALVQKIGIVFQDPDAQLFPPHCGG